jgi:hypothetical protein
MKYAIGTYIQSYINIGSSIQMLTGGIHRQNGDRISHLLIFQNKGIKLTTL